jgi:glycosyltransferase involved in cell wall biosynthesis
MPSTEDALAKRIREAARGRTVVATLGSLSRRKGVLALCKAAERLSAEPFLFVFAGKYEEESFTAAERLVLESLLRDPPANCICHFEALPDEGAFNALVSVADILTVVYEHFPYSSNLVTKAALFRKLLIGTDQGCIGERIRRFELGVTVREGDAGSIVEGLRTLRAGQEACLARAHFSDYMQLHSANRLDSVLDQMLAMVYQ